VTKNLTIISSETALIDGVTGTHLSGKTNDDVTALWAWAKGIEYFPKGLEKFFKNLKVIAIYFGRLKQISQADLKPHKNLVYIQFEDNDIEIFEDDLFSNHPNMSVVWLPRNKIVHVGKNVFNNMNKITYLGLASNPCINAEAFNNATATKALIESLKTKCFDANFARISQDLANLENESKTLNSKNYSIWRKNVENLEKEFFNSRFSNLLSMKSRFDDLKNDHLLILNRIAILEEKIDRILMAVGG
jgi:Leucine-rich repeat (LRR) protein